MTSDEAERALQTIETRWGSRSSLDGKMTGIAVATGARIASLGGPGDVLVSATVRDLLAGAGLAFQDRGLHELEGLPEARQI